mgnify:CR=1 FL=1
MDWLIKAAHAAADNLHEASLKAIDLITWLWVLGLSMFGGLVRFYQKITIGRGRAFNWWEFAGDIGVSGFVGVITFLLCKEYGMSEYLTAGLVAITGHMGSRAIMVFQHTARSRLIR